MNIHRAGRGPVALAAALSALACSDASEDGSSSGDGGAGGGAAASTSSRPAGPGSGGEDASVAATSTGVATSTGEGAGPGSTGAGGSSTCLESPEPCAAEEECCAEYTCGQTSLGQVCCGEEGATCATENGEDCCGNLLCVAGACGYDPEVDACEGPCNEPPALKLEKSRLAYIGGTFLGICGDANHTYGFHVPAANLPADDYSMEGEANQPACEWEASAIDIGMDWPVSRDWLRWLIEEIRNDAITDVFEVIGSYDGVDVRYWSDWSGWETDGIPYDGEGHDTHTHVSIYRSTTHEDHRILFGWSGDAGPE